MDAYFLNPEFFSKLNPEAVVVYCVLRADISENNTATAKFMKKKGVLASGMCVQAIARLTRLSELTVKRCLFSLGQLGYVKQLKQENNDFVYQLGAVEDYSCKWFIDIKEPKRKRGKVLTADLRKAAREAKERRQQKQREKVRLSREDKRQISEDILGKLSREPKLKHQLLQHFRRLYAQTFNRMYKFDTGDDSNYAVGKEMSKMYSYLERYLKYCGEDFEVAKNRMEFVFKNWDRIKEELKWEGALTLNLFGTINAVKTIRLWQESGFKYVEEVNKVANRYQDRKEDPDSGF